jgi:hypothetical protein
MHQLNFSDNQIAEIKDLTIDLPRINKIDKLFETSKNTM